MSALVMESESPAAMTFLNPVEEATFIGSQRDLLDEFSMSPSLLRYFDVFHHGIGFNRRYREIAGGSTEPLDSRVLVAALMKEALKTVSLRLGVASARLVVIGVRNEAVLLEAITERLPRLPAHELPLIANQLFAELRAALGDDNIMMAGREVVFMRGDEMVFLKVSG